MMVTKNSVSCPSCNAYHSPENWQLTALSNILHNHRVAPSSGCCGEPLGHHFAPNNIHLLHGIQPGCRITHLLLHHGLQQADVPYTSTEVRVLNVPRPTAQRRAVPSWRCECCAPGPQQGCQDLVTGMNSWVKTIVKYSINGVRSDILKHIMFLGHSCVRHVFSWTVQYARNGFGRHSLRLQVFGVSETC